MEQMQSDLALETVDLSGAASSQADSFTTLDYVRELYLNSEEQRKSDRKKLRLLRAAVVFLGITMAAILVSAAFVVPALLNTADEASRALAVIQTIDAQAISADIDALAIQASDTFQQVGDAVQVLDDLDMETLNSTIGELETAVSSFSQLDVAKLNEAITNLNATVEPLARLFGKK